MAEQMEPIARIGHRLRDAAKEIGLDLAQFHVEPSLDGGVDRVAIVMTVDEDFKKEEIDTTGFDDIAAQAKASQDDDRVAEGRKSLEQMREELRDPSKGLGLDDD